MNFIVGGRPIFCVVAVAATTLCNGTSCSDVSMGVNYIRYMAHRRNDSTRSPAGSKQPMPTRQNSSVLASGADRDRRLAELQQTLTSNRFSVLNQITAANAGDLKVLCTLTLGNIRDTSGLLKVDGALIFTTEYDILFHQSNDCSQNCDP